MAISLNDLVSILLLMNRSHSTQDMLSVHIFTTHMYICKCARVYAMCKELKTHMELKNFSKLQKLPKDIKIINKEKNIIRVFLLLCKHTFNLCSRQFRPKTLQIKFCNYHVLATSLAEKTFSGTRDFSEIMQKAITLMGTCHGNPPHAISRTYCMKVSVSADYFITELFLYNDNGFYYT